MALFGGRRRRADGLVGTAVIRRSDAPADGSDAHDSGEPILGLDFNHFGTRPYRFVLEVRVAGQEPYEVAARFKVPRKVENTGLLTRTKLQPGIELPVHVDPADRHMVTIDWDAYLAAPDRQARQEAASAQASTARIAELTARNPKLQAKLIANNRLAVQGWAEAVRAGSLTRAQFEETVEIQLACGRMDPADAAEARASLDGGA